jgi:hypothetical protein
MTPDAEGWIGFCPAVGDDRHKPAINPTSPIFRTLAITLHTIELGIYSLPRHSFNHLGGAASAMAPRG